jgi:ribulose-phosphate 3-epimerase
MGIIVPAILPKSHHDLDEKLARLAGIATEVQIDIVDGKFAEPATWPYAEGSKDFAVLTAGGGTLPCMEDLHIEVDLMVQDPEQSTGTWIAAGATRILAHIESTNYLPQLITDLKVKYGHSKDFAPGLLSFGLAINVGSDPALLEQYLDEVDYVQFMGIKNIGKQGQPFAPEILARIATFRKKYPKTPIQVDGGVTLATAPLLLQAGVSRLVVGSALWNAPNLKEAFAQFAELTDTHGIYE